MKGQHDLGQHCHRPGLESFALDRAAKRPPDGEDFVSELLTQPTSALDRDTEIQRLENTT